MAKIDRGKKLISLACYPPVEAALTFRGWVGRAIEFTILQHHVLVLTSHTPQQFSTLVDVYNPWQ